MKILLAGGYDTSNIGDHGMLTVFARDIRKIKPDAEIVLLSRHPNSGFDRTYGVRSVRNLDHDTKEASLGRWFNGLNHGDSTEHLRTIRKELESSDLLVIGGGRLFVDISLGIYRGPLPYYALLVTLAKFFQVPLMLFGKTIIPIDTDTGMEFIRYIVSNADAITVREEPSKRELERLGLSGERIVVLPDPALGLEYRDRKDDGLRLLKEEGIRFNTGKCVAVSLRSIKTLWDGRNKCGGDNVLFKDLSSLCDSIAEALKVDILFVPQQMYSVDDPFEDDREVARIVKKNMKQKKNAHVLRREYDVQETLALYQVSEMLIAMRRHAIVFALTQLVPVVALSGDPNIDGFMHSVGQTKNIIKLQDMNAASAISKIREAWETRFEGMKQIADRISALKRETRRYAEIACCLANKGRRETAVFPKKRKEILTPSRACT